MAARPPRSARLSRDSIVNAALTFLDREGWDALTINALANQLGTKYFLGISAPTVYWRRPKRTIW